jgi:hypothetical protein
VGDWPVSWGSEQRITAVVNTGGSGGITIPKGAAINTKGAWQELISALPQRAEGLIVGLYAYRTSSFDLAIGLAGSEIIIAADMLIGVGGNTAVTGHPLYRIPINIPAGTRLSARMQSIDVTYAGAMDIHALGGGFNLDPVLSKCATYGFISGSTKGTDIDPGATANAKGAWVEFIGSLIHPVKALIVAFNHADTTSTSSTRWLVDIGGGAAGSEKVVIPDIHAAYDYPWAMKTPYTPVIRSAIPAGSRVSLRVQCNINTATKRVLDAVLYCFY